MNIEKNTPKKSFTLEGLTFDIYQPFAEGHAMTAGEASQMNVVFAKNVGNVLRESASKGALTQADVDSKAREYEFGISSGRGPSADYADKADLAYMTTLLSNGKVCVEVSGLKTKKAKAEKIAEFYATFHDSAGIFLHLCGIASHGEPEGAADKMFETLWPSHEKAIAKAAAELKAAAEKKAKAKTKVIGLDLAAA